MKDINIYVRSKLKLITLIGIAIIIGVIFSLSSPHFFNINNLINLMVHASILAILAIGMTFVIISGGLDLSVGSNIAFSGLMGVLVFQKTGSVFLGILMCLIAGSFVGLINGIMVGYLKINAFMVTLATLAIARGTALTITGGKTISVINKAFNYLGQASWGGIPVILFLIAILYIVFYFFKNTILGRSIYAIGGNTNASKVAGIKVELSLLYVYVLSGFLAGLCSVFVIGRLQSLQPWAGLGSDFETIIAVVLGGANLAGGEGDLMESLAGVAIIGILLNALSLLPISIFYQYIVKGVIIIGAIFFYGRLQKFSY